jgi:hypothetical protein
MAKLNALWTDPLSDAVNRRDKLIGTRTRLDPIAERDAHDRLSSQIKLEEEFIASFGSHKKEVAARRRSPMSLSLRGVLQLIGIFVLSLLVIGLIRHYFG